MPSDEKPLIPTAVAPPQPHLNEEACEAELEPSTTAPAHAQEDGPWWTRDSTHRQLDRLNRWIRGLMIVALSALCLYMTWTDKIPGTSTPAVMQHREWPAISSETTKPMTFTFPAQSIGNSMATIAALVGRDRDETWHLIHRFTGVLSTIPAQGISFEIPAERRRGWWGTRTTLWAQVTDDYWPHLFENPPEVMRVGFHVGYRPAISFMDYVEHMGFYLGVGAVYMALGCLVVYALDGLIHLYMDARLNLEAEYWSMRACVFQRVTGLSSVTPATPPEVDIVEVAGKKV